MVKLLCCHHKPLPRVSGRLCCHHKPLPRVAGRLCCHHKPLPRVAGRLCCHHKPLLRVAGRLCCHHKPSFPPISGGGRSLFWWSDMFFITSPFCHVTIVWTQSYKKIDKHVQTPSDFIIFLHKTFNPREKKPPRCISAGGGSVLIAQEAGPVWPLKFAKSVYFTIIFFPFMILIPFLGSDRRTPFMS